MSEFSERTQLLPRRSPLYEIMMLIVFVFIGLFIGYFAGVLLILIFMGFDINTFQSIIANPAGNPSSWNIIMLLQAIPFLGAFIIAPLFFLRLIAHQPVTSLNTNKQIWLVPALLCALLMVVFMPLNAFFIEWNSKMDLPEWLSGIERWMQQKENLAKHLTEYLTNFKDISQLLIAMIVIAVFPAIGEELTFRGLLQPRLFRLFGNIHVAVWVTGFLFSAIHFQFYGLIPRMLLGVVLGYLYAWSGNLWYPIIGHFTNNGFTLLMIYLYNNKTVDIDIEGTASIPVMTSVLSLLFSAALLFALKQYYFKNRTLQYD